VHRALRLRAAQHGRSTAAEVREILASAVKPQGRVKLGSLMAARQGSDIFDTDEIQVTNPWMT
jgi:plasmid stability protein